MTAWEAGVRAEELAESWVNGNRTWVADQVLKIRKRRDSVLLALLVYERLYDRSSAQDASGFITAIQSR